VERRKKEKGVFGMGNSKKVNKKGEKETATGARQKAVCCNASLPLNALQEKCKSVSFTGGKREKL